MCMYMYMYVYVYVYVYVYKYMYMYVYVYVYLYVYVYVYMYMLSLLGFYKVLCKSQQNIPGFHTNRQEVLLFAQRQDTRRCNPDAPGRPRWGRDRESYIYIYTHMYYVIRCMYYIYIYNCFFFIHRCN